MKVFPVVLLLGGLFVVVGLGAFSLQLSRAVMPWMWAEQKISHKMVAKKIILYRDGGTSTLTVPEASIERVVRDPKGNVFSATLHLALPDFEQWSVVLDQYILQHATSYKTAALALSDRELRMHLYGRPAPSLEQFSSVLIAGRKERAQFIERVPKIGPGFDMYIAKGTLGSNRTFVPYKNSLPSYVIECPYWSAMGSLCTMDFWVCESFISSVSFPLLKLDEAENINQKSREYLFQYCD